MGCMKKKMMIIVPHQDDEINVAGALICQLSKSREYEVIVVFSTVGYCTNGNEKTRLYEAKKAQAILGYDRMILLAYGDNYKGKHIYEAQNDEICESLSGRSATFNMDDFESFHFSKYGQQCHYTRKNFKSDVRDLILEERPSVIVCVDVDRHPDHKSLSLIFDEVMGEILHSNDSYRPLVLKKFAYFGVYNGSHDYFCEIAQPTKASFNDEIDTALCFPYKWEERLIVKNREDNYSLSFWKSSIFKALKSHRSQTAIAHFDQICNVDECYWVRKTTSLTYAASIFVSSGEAKYLNDFKIVDTDDIRNLSFSMQPSLKKNWHPDANDEKPSIVIKLNKPTKVGKMKIYMPLSTRLCLDVYADEVFLFHIDDIANLNYTIDFNYTFFQTLRIVFDKERTDKLYISELELFSPDNESVFEFMKNISVLDNIKRRNKCFCHVSSTVFKVYVLFYCWTNYYYWLTRRAYRLNKLKF